MTILHAKSDPQFTEHLRSVLNEANAQPYSVDIAVGYFYLSGFAGVANLLSTRPGKVRILIGRTDRPTSQEIAAGYGPQEPGENFHEDQGRRKEVEAVDETVANIGRNAATQPQEDATEVGIKSLAQLIAEEKVDVRAYVKDRMHAKVYIGYTGLDSAPGTAIIGSTNFSVAGFTGNTELNYPVTHAGDILEVREWFERLWEESQPVSEQVRNEFRKSWPLAEPEPYLIYLKALYELYGDTLGEELEVNTNPPVELTEYQLDAVSAGMAMLDKHNGCYIADVVGMGKTFIGAEIIRRLTIREREAGDPLIICPASLRQMWERTCDEFGLTDAEVLSRGRLTEANLSNDRNLRKLLRNSGPVLIDEAHGFRNNNQRRRALLGFLGEAKRHKVVLLSATPQNLAPKDILQQLELFLDPNRHGLPEVYGPLTPYFPRDGSKADPDRIAKVLQHVLIRRRRKDILQQYPGSTLNGQPIRFPEPKLSNREYNLDHVYRKAGGLQFITGQIKKYKASRYKAGEYLKPEAMELPEYANIVQSYRGDLAGIMTTNLWKRLESSIPAFRSTLQVLINSNQEFRNMILNGKVSQDEGVQDSEEELTIDVPHDQELDIDDLDQEEEYITIKDQTYRASDFRCPKWLDDLEKDGEILKTIFEALADVGPDDDSKLHDMKSFIKTPGVSGQKVLIFTESKVTANYLHRELREDNQGVSFDLVMGGDNRTAEKITKFSPKSNGKPEMPEAEQTRILITTDVLAEGQNLQDCNRVFSYDLHWNPVTLIQRHGRVDRITTEHEEVYLHNMLPDPTLEGEINIQRTVRDRVQHFHDLIGLDNPILETGERVNPESIYSIYNGEMPEEEDSITDSLAVAQEANALLNRVRREDPETWQKVVLLPRGLRSAMSREGHLNQDRTIVLASSGSTKRGFAVGSDLEASELTHAQLVRQLECEPDTERRDLPDDTNNRVTAAAVSLAELLAKPTTLEPRTRDGRVTAYVNQEIRQLRQIRMGEEVDPSLLQRLEALRRAFNEELPLSVTERIRTLMRGSVEGMNLVDELSKMMDDLPKPEEEDGTRQISDSRVQIICSMGIIKPD